MKAIKINKIQWNLESLTPEEKEKAMKTLPTAKAFLVDDNFSVVKIPMLLKKKFGYDIIEFTYDEIRVVDNMRDLLLLCKEGEDRNSKKDVFKIDNHLSALGERCRINLEDHINERIDLETKGTSEYDMPVILDEVMIGLEKVTGMKWDDHHTTEEWMDSVDEVLNGMIRKIRKSADEEEEEEAED